MTGIKQRMLAVALAQLTAVSVPPDRVGQVQIVGAPRQDDAATVSSKRRRSKSDRHRNPRYGRRR